ncbi:hypothetical protein QBC43DRAFT_324219 [Cladorrhinum sp. PSN259]|nr:hypothetical protein QBC43DRAFT_324219 [Cladorrhinum sp. PSN259]
MSTAESPTVSESGEAVPSQAQAPSSPEVNDLQIAASVDEKAPASATHENDLEGKESKHNTTPSSPESTYQISTKFWRACYEGHIDEVKRLLALGADPNTERDYYVFSEQYETEFGARKPVENDKEESIKEPSPWYLGPRDGYEWVGKTSALFVAVHQRYFETAELIVDQQDLYLMGQYTPNRRTVLCEAVIKLGNPSLIRKLLEGCDDDSTFCQTPDYLGRVPFHWAAAQDWLPDVLLDHYHYTQVNLQDLEGNTALHIAIANGHTTSTLVLLKEEISQNVFNVAGKTPLECVPGGRSDLERIVRPKDSSSSKSSVAGSEVRPKAAVTSLIKTCSKFDVGITFCLKGSPSGYYEPETYKRSVYETIYHQSDECLEQATMENLIERLENHYIHVSGKKDKPISGDDLWKWIHVSTNNMTWIMDLINTRFDAHMKLPSRRASRWSWMLDFIKEHNVLTLGSSCQLKPHISIIGFSESEPTRNATWVSLVVPYFDYETETYFARKNGLHKDDRLDELELAYPSFDGGSGYQRPQTLDESYYHDMADQELSARNSDQIIWKALRKFQSTTKSAAPKLLMFNQLWLWKLEDGTIITAMPERLGDSKASQIHEIIEDQWLGAFQSPDAFIEYILTFCVSRSLECFGFRLGFDILEIFESWVGKLSINEVTMFQKFRDTLNDPLPGIDSEASGALATTMDFSITEEVKLIYELRDVLDELFIIRQVCAKQMDIMEEYVSSWTAELKMTTALEDNSNSSSRPSLLEFTVNLTEKFLRRVERLEQKTKKILENVDHLVRMKQAQGSLHESKLASQQAEMSVREAKRSAREAEKSRQLNNYIMVFTVVTVVFAPLSFMTSIFALSIDTFPLNDQGEPRYGTSWITARMLTGEAVSIVVIMAATFLLLLRSRKARQEEVTDNIADIKSAAAAGGMAVTDEQTQKKKTGKPNWDRIPFLGNFWNQEGGVGLKRRRNTPGPGDVEKQTEEPAVVT